MITEQLSPQKSTKQHAQAYGVKVTHHDAKARMDMYRFLSTIYLHSPSASIINNFANKKTAKQLGSTFGEDIVAPLYKMAIIFDSEKDMSDLQQEYMGLFSVPTGQYVAPFEDVYRGLRLDGNQERGPLLGDRAVEVKTIYRSAGANIDETCKELPTHIGVELSFMSFLCSQEAQCLQQSDTEHDAEINVSIYRQWQLKFLHEHLTDWFPQLRRAIESKAKLPFYMHMARLTQVFLEQDKAWLIQQLKMSLSSKKSAKTGQVK